MWMYDKSNQYCKAMVNQQKINNCLKKGEINRNTNFATNTIIQFKKLYNGLLRKFGDVLEQVYILIKRWIPNCLCVSRLRELYTKKGECSAYKLFLIFKKIETTSRMKRWELMHFLSAFRMPKIILSSGNTAFRK